jgi:hypothetical protein
MGQEITPITEFFNTHGIFQQFSDREAQGIDAEVVVWARTR